jgi:hypothetical protein
MFNGVIAGDGSIERMLLTGMAGDLTKVAEQAGLSLLAVQNAIRGGTLPYRAATELSASLARLILDGTRLRVGPAILESDAAGPPREAVALPPTAAERHLRP